MNIIRVALVYSEHDYAIDGSHPIGTLYDFCWLALNRHKKLNVDYLISERGIDVSKLSTNYDVVLLPRIDEQAVVDSLAGIEHSRIPVIAMAGDPHWALGYDRIGNYKKLKIDYSFNFFSLDSFYKYLPRRFKYETIVYGLEPSLYASLKPYDERRYDKIAISGVLGDPGFIRRTYRRYVRRQPPELMSWYQYVLRTKCNSLSYVTHVRTAPEQGTGHLPTTLSEYRAAIAATTMYATIKYIETTAAGCLTFMEITKQNDGQHLGYEDGKTAIFINKHNYKKKFKEFLDNPHDPAWKRIALAGQRYALEHLNNDKAADKLVQLMLRVMEK